jgi:tripartite-type tricarboxylate transporter receptor subunit TctC
VRWLLALATLAVTGEARSPQLAAVPTIGGSGHGGIVATYWNGLLAPAGTSVGVIPQLNAVFNDGLASPDVRSALIKLGSTPASGTVEEFAFIAAEAQRRETVACEANIKIE